MVALSNRRRLEAVGLVCRGKDDHSGLAFDDAAIVTVGLQELHFANM